MRWKPVHWRAIAGAASLSLASAHATLHALTDTSQIEVRTFTFSPDTLVVAPGTRIQWTNRDAIAHTITWGTPDERDERLQSATLDSAGATHTARPCSAGRYPYFCDRHQFMRGVVIVTSPGERTNE